MRAQEFSNGRLPFEDGSDWRETLLKRVSGDAQRFIFRRRKKKNIEFLIFMIFPQKLNVRASPKDGPHYYDAMFL